MFNSKNTADASLLVLIPGELKTPAEALGLGVLPGATSTRLWTRPWAPDAFRELEWVTEY